MPTFERVAQRAGSRLLAIASRLAGQYGFPVVRVADLETARLSPGKIFSSACPRRTTCGTGSRTASATSASSPGRFRASSWWTWMTPRPAPGRSSGCPSRRWPSSPGAAGCRFLHFGIPAAALSARKCAAGAAHRRGGWPSTSRRTARSPSAPGPRIRSPAVNTAPPRPGPRRSMRCRCSTRTGCAPRRRRRPRPGMPVSTDAPVYDRAAKYLAAMPLPVIGHGSDRQTYYMACRLVVGFALSTWEAEELLWQRCGHRDGWTRRWVAAKVNAADRYGRGARGGLR